MWSEVEATRGHYYFRTFREGFGAELLRYELSHLGHCGRLGGGYNFSVRPGRKLEGIIAIYVDYFHVSRDKLLVRVRDLNDTS